MESAPPWPYLLNMQLHIDKYVVEPLVPCSVGLSVFLVRPFVTYCMKRVNMLRENNIKVIMVFDGGYLPLKAGVESERRV